ncbi:hypothetical protein HPP92_026532 [Vanilla planifolia]|uniref:Uncharacterized protein n=1 Tax=Vanilla planifolia TaxID=51239 RepID=A0A835PEY7_VANPL|nr:hypothetical protein HPP92_026761 [Vanilla planifolia]KAG0450809.1 hypothetical protein HPP92_026532 [Vanilla planifolia]
MELTNSELATDNPEGRSFGVVCYFRFPTGFWAFRRLVASHLILFEDNRRLWVWP